MLLGRADAPRSASSANICTEIYNLRSWWYRCLLMVRIRKNIDCEPMLLKAVYIAVQTYVARGALRSATTISQCMTLVQLNLLRTNCL